MQEGNQQQFDPVLNMIWHKSFKVRGKKGNNKKILKYIINSMLQKLVLT